MNPYRNIQEECWDANRSLPSHGLADLAFGNVSVADRSQAVFAIKPSGVPYGKLLPSDMVVVDFDGVVVEGNLRPSSDTPTHRCLLAAFNGVRSIVHTHSRHAVAFAQAAREIPCVGTTHCDYFHGPVPVTRALTAKEISSQYEWETGLVILEAFTGLDPLSIPAILVRHHGPFVWAESAAKAIEIAVALELVADMAFKTLALSSKITPVPDVLLNRHFFRKHGPTAYYGQREKNKTKPRRKS